MPIISKETWDSIPQDEKERLQYHYKWLYNLPGNEENAGAIREIEGLFGKENLQPKPLTYEDVARELFKDGFYFIDCNGKATYINRLSPNAIKEPNNCTSEKQAEKLLAINKLLNVAKFLNKDWKPDWEAMEEDDGAWSIGIDGEYVRAFKSKKYMTHSEIVYFRTQQLAQQAIQILGEDTVRLALGDY